MDAPSSILTYPAEDEYLHRDLDLPYVDALALDLARILSAGQVAEASYEPGDMTRYRLVIVPLSALRAGQARVSPRGSVGNRHAVVGMKRSGGDDGGNGAAFYADHAYLVCVGDRSYPMWLEPAGGAGIAADYVASNFDLPATSAVSVAILLRAVCAHLDGVQHEAPADGPGDIDVLLAGLEVGSISELRRLVLAARAGSPDA